MRAEALAPDPAGLQRLIWSKRKVSVRALVASVTVVCAFALGIGLCQYVPAATAQPKPLRERLLEKALKGDTDAQFELGKNYETGRIGLPKDLEQARYWYRQAANSGDPFAAASIGILYNFGKGVKRDCVQAYMWYEVAIARLTSGDRDSVVEMRDALTGSLTPQQISEAQSRAKRFEAPAQKRAK